MITENYVSFEIAKLLKEKGFDEGVLFTINREGFQQYPKNLEFEYLHNSEVSDDEYAAPTLQMAMKWLRDVHNLHIAVIVAYHHLPRRYEAHIMKLENIDDFILHQQVDFTSYEEACEAAIKYCLENLI